MACSCSASFFCSPRSPNLLGQHQLRLSRGDHLLNGNPGTGFDERCAATRKADHGHFGNDEIDGARGRQRALVQDLRLALGSMLHGDDNPFGTSHKVHRSPMPGTILPGVIQFASMPPNLNLIASKKQKDTDGLPCNPK